MKQPVSKRALPITICLVGVTKIFPVGIFGRKTAVRDLSLSVSRGETLGLLGPNGSGKSTTLKMLLGFLRPTNGKISLEGVPLGSRSVREHLGYLPENPRFQRFLTAYEILSYYGCLYGLRGSELRCRIAQTLDIVSLTNAQNERVYGFSKGMTQRLAVAQALLHSPAILILDEPMSGLDPVGRMEIRALISRIKASSPETTIFFSSHILSDVEEVCTTVALMRDGRLVRHTSLKDLFSEQPPSFEVQFSHAARSHISRLTTAEIHTTNTGIRITVTGLQALEQLLCKSREGGLSILGLHTRHTSLEKLLFGTELGSSVSIPVRKADGEPCSLGVDR